MGGVGFQSAICLILAVTLLSPVSTDALGLSNSVKRLRQWPETAQIIEDIYAKGHEGRDYETLAIDKRIISPITRNSLIHFPRKTDQSSSLIIMTIMRMNSPRILNA